MIVRFLYPDIERNGRWSDFDEELPAAPARGDEVELGVPGNQQHYIVERVVWTPGNATKHHVEAHLAVQQTAKRPRS